MDLMRNAQKQHFIELGIGGFLCFLQIYLPMEKWTNHIPVFGYVYKDDAV